MRLRNILLIVFASIFFFATGSEYEGAVRERTVYAETETERDTVMGELATETEVTPVPPPTPVPSYTPIPTYTPVPKVTPEPSRITIAAVGDIMLGRGVGSRLERQGRSVYYPFEKVKDMLHTGDVVFCNIENPVTDSTHSLDPQRKIVLKCRPKYVESIEYAGFNMISLANNHIMDYYGKGLEDTIELLEERGMVHSGAGANIGEAREAAIMEVDGVKTGMLAYTDMAELIFAGNPYFKFEAEDEKPGVAPTAFEYILEDIEKIRKSVDILIISLHWGIEESFEIAEEQIEFAHKLIDLGADMILGHHPHQFQGMEVYNGKPIVYSMGNFIFDQNDPENQESFILLFEYEDNVMKEIRAVPVRTEAKTQVVFQEGEDAFGILNREKHLCEQFGTSFDIHKGMLVYRGESK